MDLASQYMYWLLGIVHLEFFIQDSRPLVTHPSYSLWLASSHFSCIQKKASQMERDFRKRYITNKCNIVYRMPEIFQWVTEPMILFLNQKEITMKECNLINK
jgi:hypothetical protein